MYEPFLKNFRSNGTATHSDVQTAAETLGLELPLDYVAFLLETDGGEGMIGDRYTIFWRARELSEMDASYEVQEYAPGLLVIGSDGGGEAFAFDTRRTPWPVVTVPFVGMELGLAQVIAPSFAAFIQTDAR